MSRPQNPVVVLTLSDMYFDLIFLETNRIFLLAGTSFRSGVGINNISLADFFDAIVYEATAGETTPLRADMDPSTHRLVFLRRDLDRIEIETDEILRMMLLRQALTQQLLTECVILPQASIHEFWASHFIHLPRRMLWEHGCPLTSCPEVPNTSLVPVTGSDTTVPVRIATVNPLIRQRTASLDHSDHGRLPKRHRAVHASEGQVNETAFPADFVKLPAGSKPTVQTQTSEANTVDHRNSPPPRCDHSPIEEDTT